MSNYKYVKKSMAKNCKQCGFTLNKNTDADVIAHLESQPNKRAYLLGLIRDDMKGGKANDGK